MEHEMYSMGALARPPHVRASGSGGSGPASESPLTGLILRQTELLDMMRQRLLLLEGRLNATLLRPPSPHTAEMTKNGATQAPSSPVVQVLERQCEEFGCLLRMVDDLLERLEV